MRFWIVFLLFLFVPLVGAFSVNSPVVIEVLLQDDSGSSLVSLSNASCLTSIYFFGNSSFVVHDASMTAGIPYEFIFIPDTAGDYRVSVLCSYLNESVNYHQDFEVTALVSTVTGGRGVVTLNANITVSQDSYAVNVESPQIIIPIAYTVDNVLKNSYSAKWDLLRDGNKIDSGVFRINGTGQYFFDYDVRELPVGEYEVFMWFDGVSKSVPLRVYDIPMNFITGLIVDESVGEVVTFRVIVLFFVFLLLLFILWLLLRGRPKDKVTVNNPRPAIQNR